MLAPTAVARAAQADRIFGPQVAVHAPSLPTALLASPTGKYVYAGEGGMIAVLEPTDAASMRVANKRFPVSSLGILPVALALDPAADVEDGTQDANDLLYVAAGRDGLWVIGADPRPGQPNPAVRIDDSGNNDPYVQQNRRWACDLDFVRLGEVDYLLCLFARRNQSRLRLYRLDDVRAAFANATGETGQELAPAAQVLLNNNSATTTGWFSYAYGMAVDHERALEGGADVYVALGAHGLVRVRLAPPTNGAFPTFPRQPGPWFGDGSPYATSVPPAVWTPEQAHVVNVYDDLRYWNRGLSPATLERSHPPIFTDVSVHNGYLYAAVESAGWVRFALTQTWAPNMAIDHHEGMSERHLIGTGSNQEVMLSLVEPSTEDPTPRTWTRRIQVAETHCGPVLAVTSYPLYMGFSPGTRNEGRSVRPSDLAVDHLTKQAIQGMAGKHVYTLLYDLSGSQPFASNALNHDRSIEVGGREVQVLSMQTPCAQGGPSEQTWRFVASPRSSPTADDADLDGFLIGPPALLATPDTAHSTYLVASHPSPTPPTIWVRGSADSRGRYFRQVAASASDPRVLITSSNDAGVVPDGPMWTCAAGGAQEVRVGPNPITGNLDSNLLQGGILFNGRAQWPASQADQGFFFGGAQGEFWGLTKYSIGSDLCGTTPTPPSRVKFLKIQSPNDRFDYPGRRYYGMGTVDAEYDQHFVSKTGQTGTRLIFASRVGTDWGGGVVRAVALEGRLENPGVDNGATVDPASPAVQAVLATLNTHRDFNNIKSASVDPANAQYIAANWLEGAVSTFAPRIIKLPMEEPEEDRWLLIAPSGSVALRDPAPGVSSDQYPPVPFGSYHQHGLIEVIDITNPQPAPSSSVLRMNDLGSPDLPAWSIICPRKESFIHHLEAATYRGRTYLFAADTGGELLVYDLTELPSWNPGPLDPDPLINNPVNPAPFAPVARYEISSDLTDDLPSNLYGLVVDVVQWMEGETEREELYLYLGVSRVGVEVLRLDPGTQPLPPILTYLDLLQTPGETEGLWIREDPVSGERQLLIANTIAGVRTLGYQP